LYHIALTLVSVALLLAVVTLLKERRLRLALQEILKRLILRWRKNATSQATGHDCRRNADADGDRL
jgi:hypothetical protein